MRQKTQTTLENTTAQNQDKGISSALWDDFGPTIELLGGAAVAYTNIAGIGDALIEIEKQALLYTSQILEIPGIYMIPVMSGDDGFLTAGAMAMGAGIFLIAGSTISYISRIGKS